MHTLLILFLGAIVGFEGPVWVSLLYTYFQNRQLLKGIMPTEVKEEKLCKSTHSWISASTFNDKGPATVQVCQICGFIPSINKMATPEGIDRIQENNTVLGIEKKIFNEFLAQEDEEIKEYFNEEIKNGISFEKLAHLHGAGMTFNVRLGIYKSSKSEEIKKALDRNNA